MQELESAGTLAPIGTSEDDIDRQLRELTSGASIEPEISRMKLELNRVHSNSRPK